MISHFCRVPTDVATEGNYTIHTFCGAMIPGVEGLKGAWTNDMERVTCSDCNALQWRNEKAKCWHCGHQSSLWGVWHLAHVQACPERAALRQGWSQ